MPDVEVKLKQEDMCDPRSFVVGDVFCISDAFVAIPDADRAENPRKYHNKRLVVVVYNNFLNSEATWPLVTVAPLSHRLEFRREPDIVVLKEHCEGLDESSIVRLALTQPVLKIDLKFKVGSLSEDKVTEILGLQDDLVFGTLTPSLASRGIATRNAASADT